MAEKKQGIWSKILTGGFTLLLVVLMVFVFIYLAFVPDFVAPIAFQLDNAMYDYSIDEFAEFLQENEYISTESYQTATVNAEGVTEARRYGSYYVLYWDTDNMDSESDEYATWKRYSNVGNFTLDDGTRIIVYGCFGVSYKEGETTDGEPVYTVLESFPSTYSGNHNNKTVWDYTFEEFEDYMIQLGYFTKGDYKEMSTIGTISRIYNGIDVMWWDVDNLVENTKPYKYWYEFQKEGYTLDFGNTYYGPTFNGPFAINATTAFTGNTTKLYEDFANFPRKYTPSENL
jgi:hypothetical protein